MLFLVTDQAAKHCRVFFDGENVTKWTVVASQPEGFVLMMKHEAKTLVLEKGAPVFELHYGDVQIKARLSAPQWMKRMLAHYQSD
jgi:hypothetical protein